MRPTQGRVAQLNVLVTQIAVAQLAGQKRLERLEASVQAFIDSLRRGGNGRG